MKKRVTILMKIVLATAFIGGCQEADEVRQYKAPRVEYPKGRLLGAIVPRSDFMWFFKLDGPPNAVASQKDNFDNFIQSLKFTGNEKDPVTWTVPDDWAQQPGDQMRFATLTMRTKEKTLELTVTKFDAKSNTVIDNVNRWRRKLDLPEIDSDEELARVVKRIKVENEDVVLVDLVGDLSLVKRPASKGHGMKAVRPVGRGQPQDIRPHIPAPPGWHEIEPEPQAIADVRQVKAYRIVAGTQRADVHVKVMSFPQFSLLGNVNRWRKDPLKMPDLTQAELDALARKLTCMKAEGDYVDLQGSPTGKRMLGFFLRQGRMTWVFMMTGPDALVGGEKAAFEQYVRDFSL